MTLHSSQERSDNVNVNPKGFFLCFRMMSWMQSSVTAQTAPSQSTKRNKTGYWLLLIIGTVFEASFWLWADSCESINKAFYEFTAFNSQTGGNPLNHSSSFSGHLIVCVLSPSTTPNIFNPFFPPYVLSIHQSEIPDKTITWFTALLINPSITSIHVRITFLELLLALMWQ